MAGRAGGLAGLAIIRPLLVTVVIKWGERRGGGAGRPRERDVWAVWRGQTGAGGAAACPNSVPRRVNSLREDSPRLWGRLPLSASANFLLLP